MSNQPLDMELCKKSSVIIAGDLHLLKKPGMWSGRSEIGGDDEFALKQIVELCVEHDADLFLLGDVLDSVTNLPRPLILAKRYLRPLLDAGHCVFYIQGQHEFVVDSSNENYPWLELVEGTTRMHGKYFEFMAMKAFALDYFPEPHELLHLSTVPADTEVLFLHGMADAVTNFGCHFHMENIPPSVKYIFAGDYHEAIEWTNPLGEGPILIYTGSTHLRSADEAPAKSVILATQGDGEPFGWKRVPLRSRSIWKRSQLDLENLEWVAEHDDTVPENIQTPVILVDEPTDAAEYQLLAKYGHVYTTSSASLDMPTTEEIEGEENKSDLEILQQYTDREGNEIQFDFALDVVQNSVDDALSRLREALGVTDEDLGLKPSAVAEVVAEEEAEIVV